MTRYIFNRTHPANPVENQGDKRSHHPRNRFFLQIKSLPLRKF